MTLPKVGIVIVSHSADVARGAADMVRQMAGPEVPLAYCGGTLEGDLGTSVEKIMAAIDAAWSDAGVAVLVDLGGAEMNSQMAIEMLPVERAGKVRIVDGPVVEGAVMAATEAAGGGSLDAVVAAASRSDASAAVAVAMTGGDDTDWLVATTTIDNPTGLHARPATKLTSLAKSHAARIEVAARFAGPWVDAKSVGATLGLKLPQGARLLIRTAGDDADRALADVLALVGRNFDEKPPAAAPAEVAPLHYRSRAASPGHARGPIHVDRPPDAPATFARLYGPPAHERQVLAEKIADAIEELATLATAQRGEGAEILAVHQALLADETLATAAYEPMKTGARAEVAWRQALDDRIADHESSSDPTFQARAADYVDIRDRVLRKFAGMTGGSVGPVPAGTIVVARDMTPSRFLEIDWSKVGGIALEGGSAQSHVAMLARSRGVPMVVGLGKLEVGIATTGLLNGTRGTFITDPDDYQIDWFEADREIADKEKQAEAALLAEPARTSGGQLVRVMINVANPAELDHLDVTHCDGIGLMRSEFLFSDGKPLPDEETQYHAYRRCLEWAAGRPVTIRTLDIGGDKPIKGVTREGEANPFLGTRGVRLTLSYENRELFNTQLRALARAAVHGPLKVMWPMVSLAFEHREASLLMDQAIDALHGEGIDCARPLLGIMVEVPAAALAPATIGPADFYSIGTNDLTQYVFAYARDMSGLTNYYLPGHKAVISLVENVAVHGLATGAEVSVCGDAASDPEVIPLLIKAGVEVLSVAPAAIGRVKRAIAEIK